VGADGFAEAWESRLTLAAHYGLPVAEIERLLRRYGSLVGEFLAAAACDPLALVPLAGASSYLQAEVAYAVTHEGARHLDDVLERRTRLAIETRDRGTVAAEEVAAIMAPLLGWTEAIVTDEVEAYRATVGAEVAAEQEPNDALADAHMNKVVPFLPTP
jgi:glycerol-3-phosphate dehydrogenase